MAFYEITLFISITWTRENEKMSRPTNIILNEGKGTIRWGVVPFLSLGTTLSDCFECRLG